VLRAAGETETTQENIRDWLQLDEGDPRFQLVTEKQNVAVIFLSLFSPALPKTKLKLRGLSPQTNYTDRSTPLVGEVIADFCG
jgi:hypothetical protein